VVTSCSQTVAVILSRKTNKNWLSINKKSFMKRPKFSDKETAFASPKTILPNSILKYEPSASQVVSNIYYKNEKLLLHLSRLSVSIGTRRISQLPKCQLAKNIDQSLSVI
jgi:hypothetical protein